MANHVDRIVASSAKVEFVAERDNRVIVEFRKQSIERTVFHAKGSFTKKLTNDKFFVVDTRNNTRSEGFQNHTVAIDVARLVARETFTGEMFANDGDGKALATYLREKFPKIAAYSDEQLISSYPFWATTFEDRISGGK